ncbi:peptidylprolyl isomerase [Limnohabitans sp. Rim11]|uniref:peptidylprolyl isomerase n=1 Tax=Limnohabitans sp. Rim11 TaxID=1100719 RepID=UPI000A848A4A|nr:peptidylprolyl isomerase [Limnohabitans sp. Rim11]
MTFKPKYVTCSLYFAIASTLALLLSACGGGGGFPPTITGVKPQSLMFGKTATIYLGGKDLRSSLVVESNGACINPSFASNSTTDTLVLNCLVKQAGDFVLTVKSDTGAVVYTGTLTVPNPQVVLVVAEGQVNLGNIVVELDPVAAPITVNNFLNYANNGFYRSTLFHRVISGFMIQGGGFTTGMVKKTGQGAPIVSESKNGLSNVRGSIAMARLDDKDSATSEFYINHVDNLYLDYSAASAGYTVFGKVVQGMEVVDTIAGKATGFFNGYANVPLADVTITGALQVK